MGQWLVRSTIGIRVQPRMLNPLGTSKAQLKPKKLTKLQVGKTNRCMIKGRESSETVEQSKVGIK